MTTFGNTSPSYNFWYQNTGSNNQVGTLCTATQDGLIDTLSVFCGGNGATACNTVLCLWDSSGNLLAQTATFTTSGTGTGIGNQAWQTAKLVTPYNVTSGTSYYIGFWRDPARTFNYSTQSGSGTTHKQGSDISAPGKLGTSTDRAEVLGAYATYSLGGAWVTDAGPTEVFRLCYVKQTDGSEPQRVIQVKNIDGTYHVAS